MNKSELKKELVESVESKLKSVVGNPTYRKAVMDEMMKDHPDQDAPDLDSDEQDDLTIPDTDNPGYNHEAGDDHASGEAPAGRRPKDKAELRDYDLTEAELHEFKSDLKQAIKDDEEVEIELDDGDFVEVDKVMATLLLVASASEIKAASKSKAAFMKLFHKVSK